MSISYHVYANTGAGDAVNYAAPVATVSGLNYQTSALAASSDWTFAIRAFDTVSGLEESNVDARTRVILDANGNDVSGRPTAPSGFAATISVNGSALSAILVWQQLNPSGSAQPTSFRVFQSVGSSVDFSAAPVATIAYVGGRIGYRTTLSGLVNGTQYSFAVRAANASGSETNTNAITLTASSVAPRSVQNLTGSLS